MFRSDVMTREYLRNWNTFDAVMVAEGDVEVENEEVFIDAWQYLIDTGIVWTLQGYFGRTAASLIEQGYCEAA
jgi:hypothetical protein